MLKSTKVAEEKARVLVDQLGFRIKDLVSFNQIDESRDANGWPILTLTLAGAIGAGDDAIKIQIESVDGVSPDVFGNARKAYTGHIVTILSEATIVSAPEYAVIFGEVAKQGMRVQLRETAAATPIDDAALKTATIVADLDNILWPTKTA